MRERLRRTISRANFATETLLQRYHYGKCAHAY
jgi:hypothetical protein